ncbi:MAG TPA: efflux RND transporter periplasmic adaptor subunit [Kofleriaceae bacterium]|nr:efflux RND transporter periplasmic adaptor subunit [Kofleriaceae bacterium]
MRVSWTIASILALAASAAPLAACNKKEGGAAAKAPPPPPLKITVATADEAASPEQLVLTGMIVADQRSEVTADTQGKVLNVMVERGQRVKMGAPVVQLDVRTSALAAREAQANLASARAQRELAEQECARTKQLLDKGAITRSEYDRQTTQCTSALQQVSAAEARTEMMIKSVADGIVRAPFEGVVAQKNVTAGEFVSPGRPLFTLVDDDPLKIELSVPESQVRALKEGQEVAVIAVAARDKSHKAKITRIGAEIGRTRSLIVEATLEPGSGLVPGMFAEAHVTTGSVPRTVVPKEAVVRRGKSWHAFVVVKGEAQDKIVQIAAAADPAKVAIVQGVAKGDKVVIINLAEETELAELKRKAETPDRIPEAERQKVQQRIAELEQKQIIDGRSVVE